MKNNIFELILYLRLHKARLFGVIIALFCVAFSVLLMGTIFRKFIDFGISQGETDIINEAIIEIAGLIIIFSVGSFCRSYFINMIALLVTSKLKFDSYSNLLRSNIKIFEDLKTGDIISRLSLDIESVNNLIINFLSFFVRNFIMFIGAIILMFSQSIKLSLLTLIFIPIVLLPILRLSKIVKKLSKIVIEKQGSFGDYIEESFLGVRTLYAYNQQEYKINEFNNQINLYNNLAALRLKYRSLFFALTISIIALSIITIIWIGTNDIIAGNMTSGKMMAFIYYALMAGTSSGGIIETISELQGPLASLNRVLEIKNMTINPISNNIALEIDFLKNIKYQNVNFSYPSRPNIQILNDLTINIKSGSFTAIVGKSGSGKSTLFQILLKFYQVQSGQIYIGDTCINDVDENIVRHKISYVEQNPTIFSGSIKSNILFAKPDASEQELAKVLDICGIDEFSSVLPQGINTEIGQKGIRLSGGQKQKIAIARALLYSPDILLLDEATSAIDSAGEAAILENIRKMMVGKTLISVAHRISSIEKADHILLINRGKLVDFGTHAELIAKSELYKLLYKEQI
ncbi:MAG: ATP-binding cassette domain-containing protein [Rickettsiaceae bacterium]|nr:ATP-binding cassette domain-containing protein [Rickettsiaceae bacterium]